MVYADATQSIELKGLWLLLTVIVGLLLAAATASLYDRVTERAERQAENSALAYQRLILQEFDDLDRFISRAARQLLIDRSLSASAATTLFGYRQNSHPLIKNLAVIDSDGRPLVTSSTEEVPEISGRDYFLHHLESRDSELFISPPQASLVNPDNWFISLSRALRNTDGNLLGVAVGMLSVNSLRNAFSELVSRDGVSITLLTQEGRLVFRLPELAEYGVGVEILDIAELEPPLTEPITQSLAAGLDKQARIVHLRPISNYGLVIAASIRRADALSVWRAAIIAGTIAWLVFSAISFILIRMLQTSVREAQASQARFRHVVEGASDLIVLSSIDGQLSYASPNVESYLGLKPREVIGRPVEHFVHPDDLPRLQTMLRNVIKSGKPRKSDEYRVQHADGNWRWHAVSLSPMYDAGGDLDSLIGIVRDVTQRHRDRQQLIRMANEDALTGLPNRARLTGLLAEAMREANRKGTLVGLLFIDLDHFKPVNDAHGHAVGDLLLVQVARRINNALREPDIAARFGGDEFLALLHNLSAPEEAQAIAERIIEQIRRPFQVDKHELSIACSIGIALYPEDGRDEPELFMRADAAMYRAKHAGRGIALRFTPNGEDPPPG
ncbi:diguanylate cyclase domain-containing protein [Wenzhouxiangella limi]|uniref:Diguanylate cyclase n=1 Tax=Wenzhouxiangella limi TaxID=2707351 RepID=A0A845UYM8_9GAMM|nr:diguanylate cyclase [Wenzhouxiangella limi]